MGLSRNKATKGVLGRSRPLCLNKLLTGAILLIITAFPCCQPKKGEPGGAEPEISRDSLPYIIAEMHLADAVIVVEETRMGIAQPTDSAYYEPIFRKYGTSRADFQAAVHYYANHPEEFEEIYNEVTRLLDQRLKAAQTIAGNKSSEETEPGKPRRLFRGKDSISGSLPDSVMRKAGENAKKELERRRQLRQKELQEKKKQTPFRKTKAPEQAPTP